MENSLWFYAGLFVFFLIDDAVVVGEAMFLFVTAGVADVANL